MEKDIRDYLPGLSYHYVSDQKFRNTATAAGFRPDDLPDSSGESCDFKKCLVEFDRLTTKKEKAWIYESIYKLADHETIDQIPLSEDEFGKWYRNLLFNYKTRVGALELATHPSKIFTLYSEVVKLKNDSDEVVLLSKIFDEEFNKFVADINSDQTVIDIPSWPLLSKMIGGFNPGRLTMLLANTGYGKTNFMVNLSLSAAQRFPVMFINMEMLITDIFRRIVVSQSGKSWDDIRNKEVPEYKAVSDKLMNTNELYITSGKDQSIDDIKDLARIYNAKTKLGLICVDYDQKLKLGFNSKSPEWLELQKAFIELESLAKELKTHVIIASQSSDDDGKVSGSHRSKFPCSAVLYFHEDEVDGPVIEPKKNRFGNYKQRLKVNYIKERSLIEEVELVDSKKKNQEIRVTKRTHKKEFKSTIPYQE